jgi:hypothetical protein
VSRTSSKICLVATGRVSVHGRDDR